MKRSFLILLAAALLGTGVASRADPELRSILTHHGHPDRSGDFVVPALTWDRARSLRLDEDFRPRVSGNVYAQPLYWRPPGSKSAIVLLATENNVVYAIDAKTGAEVWKRSLGKPVPRSALPCGNIDTLGITGTPVIDESTEAIYLDAAIGASPGLRHRIFALSLKDGSILPGWPVDVADALERAGQKFAPLVQNQRGALTMLNGMLYAPFGGHGGDCGDYHGVVVGVSVSDPRMVKSWRTRARGAGVWAPGGISSDGKSLFVATGNSIDVTTWSDGEAVLRLAPDLHRSDDKRDFFAPTDWKALDDHDTDLGGSNPLPLDVPAQTGDQALILALGKDGKAYLLDRNDLGGIGGALAVETVAASAIRTAPAAYRVGDDVFVAFQGQGAHCPATQPDVGLTVLKIQSGSPPTMTTAWCAPLSGGGSPIATTTDGRANPIVWILGAEGDNRLHGYRGDTGEPLFVGPSQELAGLRHFQTLIATENRLYVGADGTIYAFAF
jgi:outer membrane protein assembly factor BamB